MIIISASDETQKIMGKIGETWPVSKEKNKGKTVCIIPETYSVITTSYVTLAEARILIESPLPNGPHL